MIKWLLACVPFWGFGQSFAPEPGSAGSTAIHKDSSIITYWAENVFVERGFLDIADPNLGFASFGVASDAEGPADGISVVSLGDGGVATYFFAAPISDGPGPDFAVFENGFIDHYMELAFVEVSSDNQTYVRFDAVSEIQTDVQLSNFDTVNCRYVHNFAGKYRANYGTPFDLNELAGAPGLDLQAITSIRIVDVVGTIDTTYARMDSQGHVINDPYPTLFASGGFDLDGLALLQPYWLAIDEAASNGIRCYPNPVKDLFHIEGEEGTELHVYDAWGRLMGSFTGTSLDVSQWQSGTYILETTNHGQTVRKRFVKT